MTIDPDVAAQNRHVPRRPGFGRPPFRRAGYGLAALVAVGGLLGTGMALAPALRTAAASPGANRHGSSPRTGTAVAGASAGTGGCPAGAATVTVGGQATVNGTPDEVVLSVGIESSAPSAAQALSRNAQESNALVGKLKKDGIPSSRIQTSGISLQPNYNNKGNIDGYQVSNSLSVTLYDIASAGTVIDTVTSIAGNSARVDGISFSIRNTDKLMGQARQAAVRQAIGQARLMASASGSHVGLICSLKDQSSQGVVTPVPYAAMGVAAAKSAEPVEAGSMQVSANVTVVVELLPGS